ncbi:MAG TPA: hypothetical protein VGM47_05400 [Gammaproteobacteria bacterium]|jgi:hypothetical protein
MKIVPARYVGLLLLSVSTYASAATPAPALTTDMGPVHVDYEATGLTVTEPQVLHWIDTARRAVTEYYGRYPVATVTIRVKARPGDGDPSGTTYGDEDGAYIRLGIGTDTSDADLQAAWVMTHEMVHLAFPHVAENHHWIEEGLATYVEPIARAQIGDLSVDYLWQETIEGMPKGLPGPDDQGLDHTPTWGRTYWGGAMFCLLADVQIREQTHNKKGLQDALRGILADGGNLQTETEMDHVLHVADAAVGGTVLEDLYAQMKDKPVQVDLPALWKKLGVSLQDGKVVYDDKAPDAAIRKAITAPVSQ